MTEISLPLLPLVLADVPWGLRTALIQQGISIRAHVPGEPSGRFVLFDSSLGPAPAVIDGQQVVDVQELRRDLRPDAIAMIEDERSLDRDVRVGEMIVRAHLSAADKRAARRKLIQTLRTKIEASGGIWLTLSAFPYPYRSAFNVRLDHERCEPNEITEILAAIDGHEGAFSHYLTGSSAEVHAEALRPLRGCDVGSRGYRPRFFAVESENRRNAERGIESVRRLGFEPTGYAAPEGRYDRNVQPTLAALGISHTSEASLAFDELPFFPVGSDVLQIPTHPVGLELCLDTAEGGTSGNDSLYAASEAASIYFEKIATMRYQTGEPLLLFGQAGRQLLRYPQILQTVLQTATGFAALWKTTLAEYAAWWRACLAVQLQVFREPSHYTVVVAGAPAGFRLGAEYWRGEHVAPMPLDTPVVHFSPSALMYQRRKPRDPRKVYRLDAAEKLAANQPIREIDPDDATMADMAEAPAWQTWVRDAIRRIRPS